jgi:uncharacterized 2Fe-2S/4Fe-4S cluster protein (DUF4445 family)
MSGRVTLRLNPIDVALSVKRGTPLQDVLFTHGVEFPCGGKGRCKGCRVRLLEGILPITRVQESMLSAEELRAGWRLSCQCSAEEDVTLEMAQWEASILSDDTPFSFKPRSGYGVAVDVGTTTLVAQLINLSSGHVLAVRTALNHQARHGSDIMSRIGFAVAAKNGSPLTELIRKQIGGMVDELLEAAGKPGIEIDECVLVGNTVMHHLFCGLDVEPLARVPFTSTTLGTCDIPAGALGWRARAHGVRFHRCIGGFVGSDILAGIHARGIESSDKLVGLIDLGTNGEIVFGSRERIICASTAAGPAFEGARISMGMRAATGAISEVRLDNGKMTCHVLGHVTPRGICGSGLVDAVAVALELGLITSGGRFTDRSNSLMLHPPVRISQTDVRELQMAKGAVAAGIRILLREFNAEPDDVTRVYLAGAFGNYINIASARRIGLLPFREDTIVPAGNTALLGAKMSLFSSPGACDTPVPSIEHLSLNERPVFQDMYVENMKFPESNPG